MIFGGLYTEEESPCTGRRLDRLKKFLAEAGLSYDDTIEHTVLLTDDEGEIKACGSAAGNVLKCIAVSDDMRGEGLTATVVSALMRYETERGITHLFLFTKPANKAMFTDLGFSEILCTDTVLFMENKKNGIASYVDGIAAETSARVDALRKDLPDLPAEPLYGAVVANCDPFTKGHRYLIEEALKQCDLLHLFVLSEDRSHFPAKDRYEMAKAGTADLNRVLLHPTSDYLISAATFPTYFIKDTEKAVIANTELDVRIFGKCIAGPLHIRKRFAGTEPGDPVTRAYNETMARILPEYGVEFIEIGRLSAEGVPVSAKKVRAALNAGDDVTLRTLLPGTTYQYLRKEGLA